MVQASTKITDFVAGSTLVKKSLIDTAVPSVFRWTQEPSPASASRVKRAVQRNDRRCRLFEALPEAYDKQDGNILVMSEVDFHLNMEAVVELAEGMSIGGVAQRELAFLACRGEDLISYPLRNKEDNF